MQTPLFYCFVNLPSTFPFFACLFSFRLCCAFFFVFGFCLLVSLLMLSDYSYSTAFLRIVNCSPSRNHSWKASPTPLNNDGLVKSRHTREGGYPESLQLLEKTGFPIKDFGNDSLKKDFLRVRQTILPVLFFLLLFAGFLRLLRHRLRGFFLLRFCGRLH